MKNKSNWVGMIGLVTLIAGAVIFRSRGALVPWWLSWILGPLLWYVGGGMAIASLIQRMFSGGGHAPEQPRSQQACISYPTLERKHNFR